MRVFVAIEISDEKIINSIKQVQEKINIAAKPTKLENLHFTLQFLGEISDEKVSQIIKVLRTIEFSSFDINLRGLGIFPKSNNPRIIWVGISNDEGKQMLIELTKKVEKTLGVLGFVVKKPAKPHITIFRIKKKPSDITKELNQYNTREFGVQRITSIKLKKSELTPDGPIYSDLTEVKVKNESSC